jgi:hypothetical protein
MAEISAANVAQAQTKRITPDYSGARRWLWRMTVIMIVGTWAGTTWDRIWHATVFFDGFWSPPHLAIYATVLLVSLIVIGMVFTDHIRIAFGRGFDVKFLPFKVPGALFILSGGMVMLGVSGAVFDNIWHTAFGLDETNWSFPHAMIGWSLLIVLLGVLSCRLSMVHIKQMPWTSKLLLGWLVVISALSFMGPLASNRTPEQTAFWFRYIPSLADQESAQRVFRLMDTFNLNRTNPLLMLAAPLWLGAALGFLRKLDARWWLVLLTMTVVSSANQENQELSLFIAQYDPAFANPANWQPLPLFLPTLLVIAFPRLPISERVRYALAGILFGLLIFDLWGTEGSWVWLLALVALPIMWLGKWIGEQAFGIIEKPWSLRTVMPIVVSVFAVPGITGIIDLVLRANTP